MSDYAHTARDLPEASLRDLTTRYLELLDLSVRSRFGQQPVAVGEALERLAVSEAISRYAHNGRQVDILAALNAGASWRDVADALDAPQAQLRAEFARWVDGQRELYDALPKDRPGSRCLGMSSTHADAAMLLAESASERSGRCRDA